MQKQYTITSTNENGENLYFLHDYACFSVKSGSKFINKKEAQKALNYAKKCASSQIIIDTLKVEEI